MASRAARSVRATTPKSTENVGTLTWYGLTATTHEHACLCGQSIRCGREEPCIIEAWCGGEHAKRGDCAWCGGTGTYARAMAEPDGKVACGYCLGTGARAKRPSESEA